jgi:hypothetical protein
MIIDEVALSVGRWQEFAKEAGVSQRSIVTIQKDFLR